VILPLHQIGTAQYARQWETREPEVLDWIDAFEPGAVFFDVGANFGTETLYAALKPGAPRKIFAFDIELLGSYNLAVNLLLNRIDNVENYVVGLGDRCEYQRLPDNTNYYHLGGLSKYSRSMKTVYVSTIDVISEQVGAAPNYVKIDVDGPEESVIRGMMKTIASPHLRSVMVEVNGEETAKAIRAILTAAGFSEQAHTHENAHNVIFRREPAKHNV
jgi:FkbM family methyltransferase